VQNFKTLVFCFSFLALLFVSCSRDTTNDISDLKTTEAVEIAGIVGELQDVSDADKALFKEELINRAANVDFVNAKNLQSLINLDKIYSIENDLGENYLIALWQDDDGTEFTCKALVLEDSARRMDYFCYSYGGCEGCDGYDCDCDDYGIGGGGCSIG